MMECDVKDHCKTPTLCHDCEPWYRDYVRACKERGIPATPMRTRPFSPIEDTKPKGDDMTQQEAAKELGISTATVKMYLSKGKLRGDGNGGVDEKSVAEYKQKRQKAIVKESATKVYEKGEPIKSEAQTVTEAIEDIEAAESDTFIIGKDTFTDALKAAYQQGRADALKDVEARKVTLEEVLNVYIPKIKEAS